jgi:hypothetical protein
MPSAARLAPSTGSIQRPSSAQHYPSANLNGNGTTEINSYQVGVYSAWVGAHLCKVFSAAACSNIATCASASSI